MNTQNVRRYIGRSLSFRHENSEVGVDDAAAAFVKGLTQSQKHCPVSEPSWGATLSGAAFRGQVIVPSSYHS